MPSQEEYEELKGRIVELENRLKERSAQQDVTALSREEVEAYLKVRDVLLGPGRPCINECQPCTHPCIQPCVVHCWRCAPCVFECNCGPCLIGQAGGAGAVGRFAGLGG